MTLGHPFSASAIATLADVSVNVQQKTHEMKDAIQLHNQQSKEQLHQDMLPTQSNHTKLHLEKSQQPEPSRKQPVEEAYLIELTEKGNSPNDPQAPQKHANSSILLTFLKSLKISVPFALLCFFSLKCILQNPHHFTSLIVLMSFTRAVAFLLE
jgi:hypothetical protein